MKIILINKKLAEEIKTNYGQVAFDHINIKNGLSFAAIESNKVIGFISATIKNLPYIHTNVKEAYMDIIEVHENHRKKGIAKKLVSILEKYAKKSRCYQLRGWSAEDRLAAIHLWKKLEFGLDPQEIISEKTGEKVKGYFFIKVL